MIWQSMIISHKCVQRSNVVFLSLENFVVGKMLLVLLVRLEMQNSVYDALASCTSLEYIN